MNEPFFLRDFRKLDAQGVRNLALKDWPESVGIKVEIENTDVRNYTDNVRTIPRPEYLSDLSS